MYLKAIELNGFKSFASRTRLELDEGLTAIIGPNGSGKSNLADAVRWVLGEQSSRTLRGQQMGDLIFAGSSEQRASSMAEVQLIFDNSDYKLPLPQTEVSVARRIFRDGTSEYLMGGTVCRLRDITELFTDTGLGKSSFAIISQGQIDAILDERAEERRGIFEEAAGIARQRQRKTEAITRLNRVTEQLIRVSDLMESLHENEDVLAGQAEEAIKYIQAQSQLRLLENAIYYHDLLSLESRLHASVAETVRADDTLLKTQNEIAITEAKQIRLREDLAGLEEAERQTSTGLWQSRQDQERHVGEQRLWQQRLEQLARQREQHKEAVAALEQEISVLELEHEGHQQGYAGLSQRRVELEQELSRLESERQLSEEKIQALLLARSAQREAYLANSRTQLRDEVLMEQRKTSLVALSEQTEALRQRDGVIEKQREDNQISLAEAAAIEDDIQERLDKLADDIAGLHDRRESLELQVNECRKRREDTQQQLAAVQARRRMLHDLEEQREGFNRTLQLLLAEKDRGNEQLSGLIDLLSRVIVVQADMEAAIEVALGAAAQFLVCETETDAEAAISWLKNSKAGRATFLPIDVRLRSSSQRPAAPSKREGFIGFAADLVSCDERFKPIVERQLGRIIVMSDLNSALTYTRKSGYRERIVTLEGDLLYPGGSLQGGSMPRRDSSLLARPRLLAQAESDMARLASELRKISEDVAQAEAALKQESTQDSNRHSLQLQLERDLAAAQEQRRVRQREEETLRQQQRDVRAQLQQLNLETQAVQTEYQLMQVRMSEPDPARDLWESEEDSLIKAEEAARLSHQNLVSLYSSTVSTLDHTEDQTGETAVRMQHSRHKLDEALERMQALLRGITEQSSAEEEAVNAGDSALLQINNELARQEQLSQRLQEYGRERAVLSADITNTEQQLGTLRRQEERHNRRSSESKMQQVRIEDEKLYLQRRLEEEQRLTPEQLLLSMDPVISNYLDNGQLIMSESWLDQTIVALPDAERNRNLKRLTSLRPEMLLAMRGQRDILTALGNVNLGAIEELQKLQDRLALMTAQSDDLRTAYDDLQHLITDLENLMGRQFSKTIAEISVGFEDLFTQLFGGGEAKIHLSQPENPLNGGVEISVRLPGKRTGSLTLLSGGERALTALALLLAIMRIKAPPFCLLDEVETSLDESNLERLSGLLQSLSRGYQMMIITHRRVTMEAARTLIGITMRTRGVSTALSIKLEDVEAPEYGERVSPLQSPG